MSESEKLRKIFIGGLNWETTEEGLKAYFSKWGTIVDCVIMKKDGKSRGFGFVTYSSSKSVDDCLKIRGHTLDDREIEPKRSIPKDEAKNPMALTKTRKIFVGGLASTTTEDDIRDYFNGLCDKDGNGQVIDIDLKRDKENPNRIRGFAFVTFDNEEMAEKVCALKFHEIRMKQCEVKKAEPQSMLKKRHEEEHGSYSSDRDRDRGRDRDSRDRGDRDRGDRDRSSRDRERGRDGEMGYFNPFGFNPAAFGPGAFGPGFGFGGMGFGGFPAGFGYGGFPGFGAIGAGFGGFGPGGGSSDRGSGGSYDKGNYGGGGGYRSSSERESQSSKSQSAANGGSSNRGAGSYDQSGLGGSYGYGPFGSMGGSMVPSGEWGNFPAAAMMSMYGYGASTSPGAAGSDSSSKGYSASAVASDSSFPSMSNYSQMNSSFGPLGRNDSTGRALSGTDTKGSRGYRPY